MWLLNTETCELEQVNDAKGFAILSHVWNKDKEGEQSFADIQNLQKSIVARTGRVAGHDRSIWYKTTDKIRNFCAFARRHGHSRVWVDTCCIDKSSSAELSEAINSMYDWYYKARVCYVYLSDVSDLDHPVTLPISQFRRSHWFTRGWTLQELIAPGTLVFLSKEWTIIGTKVSLAHLIEEITGIDADILVHRKSLDSVSVAQRMSWASQRLTTRVEDEAYCLMGIFGVKMPTIYGEGRSAFVRLQEEILKRTCDQTLFVWGNIWDDAAQREVVLAHWPYEGITNTNSVSRVLFADSPKEFRRGNAAINAISIDELQRRLSVMPPVPEYTFTGYGIRSTFPTVTKPRRSGRGTVTLAILACEDKEGCLLALLLSPLSENSQGSDRFTVGVSVEDFPRGFWSYASEVRPPGREDDSLPTSGFFRVLRLPSSGASPLKFNGNATGTPSRLASMSGLWITHRPDLPVLAATSSTIPSLPLLPDRLAENIWKLPCHVIFRSWNDKQLRVLGYRAAVKGIPRTQHRSMEMRIGFSDSRDVFKLVLTGNKEKIVIHVGKCPLKTDIRRNQHLFVSEDSEVPPAYDREADGLCAALSFVPDRDPVVIAGEEGCQMIHVRQWKNGAKTFRRGTTTVHVEFVRPPDAWIYVADSSEVYPIFDMVVKIDLEKPHSTRSAPPSVDVDPKPALSDAEEVSIRPASSRTAYEPVSLHGHRETPSRRTTGQSTHQTELGDLA